MTVKTKRKASVSQQFSIGLLKDLPEERQQRFLELITELANNTPYSISVQGQICKASNDLPEELALLDSDIIYKSIIDLIPCESEKRAFARIIHDRTSNQSFAIAMGPCEETTFVVIANIFFLNKDEELIFYRKVTS